MDEALIDKIYEAAAVPELWVDVLDELSRMTGGAGASIVTAGAGPLRWVATPAMDTLIRDFATNSVANPRMADVMTQRYPGFITDHDILPESVIESDPFYVDFMRPRGFGWCAGAAFFPPSADPIILAIEKRYADGPFDRDLLPVLDSLRAHLARSSLLSAQLALEHARATTSALGRIGLPAAVLDARHRLRAANPDFEALIPGVMRDRQSRVTVVDKAADTLFSRALDALSRDTFTETASIPVRAGAESPPIVLHLLPVQRSARDIFGTAATILVATPVSPSAGPSTELLEGLFDLTPAESRVAKRLAEGQTIDEIAAALAISRNTVRTHLRSLFAKTATGRQAEFVRLLGQVTR